MNKANYILFLWVTFKNLVRWSVFEDHCIYLWEIYSFILNDWSLFYLKSNSLIFVVKHIRSALSVYQYFFELIDTFIQFPMYFFKISLSKQWIKRVPIYILSQCPWVSSWLLQFLNLSIGRGHQFLHRQLAFAYIHPTNSIFCLIFVLIPKFPPQAAVFLLWGLKSHCLSKGYDFKVLPLLWTVLVFRTFNHSILINLPRVFIKCIYSSLSVFL